MPTRKKLSNAALSRTYDAVYKGGSSHFYTFSSFPESQTLLNMLPSWNNLDVLEIGCGEGRLAAMMAFAGANQVDAVDYSQEAIDIACRRINLDNVRFVCGDCSGIRARYDVVVMQGVLEHMDKPFSVLDRVLKRNLRPGGTILFSCPSFLNPRGYVWMTLHLLFGVPMSLTDIHFLCPFDVMEFAEKRKLSVTVRSSDQDWGSGQRLLIDFRKRLPNALRDAGMKADNVDRLLEWLRKAAPFHVGSDFTGANVVYKFTGQKRR
jgi:SAM-dependent methyltransferase